MIGIVRQRALGSRELTMARIVIAVRTTARIESGIGAAETTATQEERSRSQGKTPRILSPPGAGSIKQL